MKIFDNEGYNIDLKPNYSTIEECAKRYESDKDEECIYLGIDSSKYGTLCMGLTIEQTERLINEMQSMVCKIKGDVGDGQGFKE